jgi:hypothetical protein
MTAPWAMTVIVLSAAASCGCSSLHNFGAALEQVRGIVRKFDCRDGAPAKILIDPRCTDGICGVTCAPDRWRVQ